MRYVYLIQSLKYRARRYKGATSNLRNRLKDHNMGKNRSTTQDRPWEFIVALRFKDDNRAREFERYLKSGSGKAFANRHFW